MVIKRQWTRKCRRCGRKITLYEYEGLEGRLYDSPHYCKKAKRRYVLCRAAHTPKV